MHSFIPEFIRRPFKKSTQRHPRPATAIQISLKQPAKRTFIIFRQHTDFQGESIPGTNVEQWCTTFLGGEPLIDFLISSGPNNRKTAFFTNECLSKCMEMIFTVKYVYIA